MDILVYGTSQQKIFLVVGPKRSGKGTLARILSKLIGPGNVVGPTLNSLTTNFGLQPLLGKSLAIISDARLGGRINRGSLTERLLSMSGEDSLTVDRKNQSAWTGKLNSRILIFTNELPILSDAAGALTSRIIVLNIQKSFYGKEDIELTDKLLEELPGILMWAIEGWHHLQERGYMVQPESGKFLLEDLEAITSPIISFVSERCVLDPTKEIEVSSIFHEWEKWCEEGHIEYVGSPQIFGRNLHAAVPGLKTKQVRRSGGTVRVFHGIDIYHPDPHMFKPEAPPMF